MIVVGLTGKPGSFKLETYGEWPLPSGLVVDGEVIDADLFARELKEMVGKYKLRGKAVNLAVSNQKVIVRNIEMPDMTEEELVGAIQFQAQEYIPIPIEEVVLDTQVTNKKVAPDGTARQDVLLVAAQKTMVEIMLAGIRQSGLKVDGIDVASLALTRSLLPDASLFPGATSTGISRGIADISSSVSTLLVAVDGVMRFTRIVNFPSDRFARSLLESIGVSYEDAQVMTQRIGLPGPYPPDSEFYPDNVIRDTQAVLTKVGMELAEEIKRSFDYYRGQERAAAVSELTLSGRGALVRNLDAHLSNTLGMPVVIGNPLTHIAYNGSGRPDAELAAMAPCLSIAIGLALAGDD